MVTKKITKLNLIIFFLFAFVFHTYCQVDYITNDDGYNVISDSTGFYIKNNKFNHEKLFPKSSWTGDWIGLNQSRFNEYQETQIDWRNNPGYKKQYKALFRKNFDLA